MRYSLMLLAVSIWMSQTALAQPNYGTPTTPPTAQPAPSGSVPPSGTLSVTPAGTAPAAPTGSVPGVGPTGPTVTATPSGVPAGAGPGGLFQVLGKLQQCQPQTLDKSMLIPSSLKNMQPKVAEMVNNMNITAQIVGMVGDKCHAIMTATLPNSQTKTTSTIQLDCMISQGTIAAFNNIQQAIMQTKMSGQPPSSDLMASYKNAMRQYMQECTFTVDGKVIRLPMGAPGTAPNVPPPQVPPVTTTPTQPPTY